MVVARVFCILLGVHSAFAGESTHTYEKGETLTIWVNTVGPYYNPQETYRYDSLPVCKPKNQGEVHYSDRWGSRLEGHELSDSGIPLSFMENKGDRKSLCKFTPSDDQAKLLVEAISSHYWYQMYLDDLPIWAMLGEMLAHDAEQKDNILTDSNQRNPEHDHTHSQEKAYLYTHKAFSIAYNGDQVIEVNLTSEHPVPVVANKEIEMTYSVAWSSTNLEYFKRFDRYLDFKFFEHQIHWFAIFNSFMLVIFLCGLVALILMRTLKNDCARYAEDDDLELDNVVDESGWKLVHGDVFREPPHLLLFSALVGTGWQLYALATCVIGFAMVSTVYDTRGTMTTAFLVFYALTAVAAGYGSASYYRVYHQRGVDEWKKVMFVTAVLFPGVALTILGTLNTIAISYSSSATVPFVSFLGLIALWAFVDLPLLLIGTLLARKYNRPGDFPCRVSSVARVIPDTPTYVHPYSLGFFGGVLPFGAIFIEMYFVFTAFWNYKFYYVYGFMALVFIILTIVIVCVTIASTYFLLNFEDWRWQWTAFMSGGSTALYVFVYSIYYFATKTKMSGFFQTCFYFGYMGIFSFALFVLCGTIGFLGTHLFVRRLYNIKTD